MRSLRRWPLCPPALPVLSHLIELGKVRTKDWHAWNNVSLSLAEFGIDAVLREEG